MTSKLCFAALLTLLTLLPAQAQAPDYGGQKARDNTGIESTLRFSIYGAVNKPGIYHFKQSYRLSDALSTAAGPTERADLSLIMLSHSDKFHNTTNMVWVNFNDFILHGKISGNPLLQPGDELYLLGKGSRYKPLPPEFVN